MNQELINHVVARSADLPDWLMKKRQLALLMQDRLKNDPEMQPVIEAWQANPDLDRIDESDHADNDWVNLPLFKAVHEYPELLQENLMEKAISWEMNQLNAMHLALLNGGRFIYIPDGVVVAEPIELNTRCAGANYHNLVLVGANAKVTVIEHQTALSQVPTYFGTELLLGDGAQVEYYQSNTFTATQNHQAVRAYQAQNSQLNLYFALLDAHDLTTDFYVDLDGQGSQAQIKMVALTSQQQFQDVQTKILNHAPHTKGDILQNGVAKDQSKLDFHAVGQIEHGAHDSNSQQTSRVLTLSDACQCEADPILLIEENDVSAGHAASIGQVNADDLYYLQSRGLSENEAQALLIRGFLLPILEQFPRKEIRTELTQALFKRLER